MSQMPITLEGEEPSHTGPITVAEIDQALGASAANQPEVAPVQQHNPLRNAAEQFLAACRDGNAGDLLDYFADIFSEALKED